MVCRSVKKMNHPYEISFSIDNLPAQTISGEITQEDWDLLEEFSRYAEECLTTELALKGVPVSVNLRYGKKNMFESTAELPDWDDVQLFLHKFRPIGLQESRTSFLRICNLLAKILDHPRIRSFIGEQRARYNLMTISSIMSIQIGKARIISEKFLQDYLNAFEYHRDKEKQLFFDEMNSMFPTDIMKAYFVLLLSEKIQALQIIFLFVRTIMGKRKEFRVINRDE